MNQAGGGSSLGAGEPEAAPEPRTAGSGGGGRAVSAGGAVSAARGRVGSESVAENAGAGARAEGCLRESCAVADVADVEKGGGDDWGGSGGSACAADQDAAVTATQTRVRRQARRPDR